jgi:GNAT superfamily N-acetyltransferase
MMARPLGSMFVAGERIRIEEALEFEPTLLSKWLALLDDGTEVGYAYLTRHETEDVSLWANVNEDYRGIGLGKLLIRLATDQAIYYRRRRITTIVAESNATAIHILETEDFDKTGDAPEGFVFFKKELKWQ